MVTPATVFLHTVAIAIVDHRDSRARLDHMILEVVHVPQALRHRGVAVAVVRVRRDLIVRVVVRQSAWEARNR